MTHVFRKAGLAFVALSYPIALVGFGWQMMLLLDAAPAVFFLTYCVSLTVCLLGLASLIDKRQETPELTLHAPQDQPAHH